MKKEKKRQYTKQIFLVKAANGTGMACRLIKNKKKGRPFDVIEILIKGRNSDPILFWVSPDEALQIAMNQYKTAINRKKLIRELLEARYTYKEIGKLLKVTRQRVCQLAHYYFTDKEIKLLKSRNPKTLVDKYTKKWGFKNITDFA